MADVIEPTREQRTRVLTWELPESPTSSLHGVVPDVPASDRNDRLRPDLLEVTVNEYIGFGDDDGTTVGAEISGRRVKNNGTAGATRTRIVYAEYRLGELPDWARERYRSVPSLPPLPEPRPAG